MAETRSAGPVRWVVRILGGLIMAALLLPIAHVTIHRFVPAPATYLAVSRAMGGKAYERRWVPIERISPHLVTAVIAGEDAGFCRHHGFDLAAMERALKHNERRPNRIRGGSTISQQTAKNVFLWPGRGFVRKGVEAYYTVLMEAIWGKRRIMEMYLNIVEWAPGVYGAEAASRHWYRKSAAHLTQPEAARLAAILPRPLKRKPGAQSRRGRQISANMGEVRVEHLADCVLKR
jgi:monofunctional biosynthetic peptidoglycan transglycosylase